MSAVRAPSPPRVDPTGQRAAAAAFAGVFGATLLAFVAIGVVLPALPRYVTGPLGSDEAGVGLVVGAFAFTAIVARPLAGRLADARGRRAVVVAGALVMALAGAGYALADDVASLVAARLVLGAGEALVFTAGAAWTVDLAPPDRRGRVIGLYGLAVWGGLALGPPLGEALLALGSYGSVWAGAAAFPLVGAVLAARVPDRHEPVEHGRRGPLVPRAALGPGLALALANVGYAALAGFVVLHLAARGVGGGAAVFTAFALAVVATRLGAGHLPDRLGPRRSALIAAGLEAAGLALVALAPSAAAAVAGGLVMGAGFSLLYPALALLVMERTDAAHRGSALGAFGAFFDLGVGLGAPLVGAVAKTAGYGAGFWLAAAAALAAAGMVAGTRTVRRGDDSAVAEASGSGVGGLRPGYYPERPMQAPAFRLSTGNKRGAHVIEVAGELDLATAGDLRDALAAAVRRGERHVVVDLSRTTFIDSTGLSALLNGLRRLTRAGARMGVVAQGDVLQTFALTRLDTTFHLYPSLSEALDQRGRLSLAG